MSRPFPWTHAVGFVDAEAVLNEFKTNVTGMLKIGTRAQKSEHQEADDTHVHGDHCTILGVVPYTFPMPGVREFKGAYFVEWDDIPGAIGFVIAPKLKAST